MGMTDEEIMELRQRMRKLDLGVSEKRVEQLDKRLQGFITEVHQLAPSDLEVFLDAINRFDIKGPIQRPPTHIIPAISWEERLLQRQVSFAEGYVYRLKQEIGIEP